MRFPALSLAKRKQLVRFGRSTGDPATALRCLMVAKLGRGPSANQVARELACAVSTVLNAAHRYIEEGTPGLLDRRVGNGNAKVDEPFLQRLHYLLCYTAGQFGWKRPTWTRELLCLQMERDGFPRVAVCTMGRALVSVGARLGSPKPVVLCPWPRRRRLRVLAELRRLAERSSPGEPVFYGDEVDIHLNPKIGRDWMLPGVQRRVVTPGKNHKHYLAGALEARTGKLVFVDAPGKSSALFCKLLWRLATTHSHSRRIHVIVDNFAIHSSKITQRCLADLGGRVVLHFLPPYCPDANRIERRWLDLHANVTRNHRCTSMTKLLAEVFDYLGRVTRRAVSIAARSRAVA